MGADITVAAEVGEGDEAIGDFEDANATTGVQCQHHGCCNECLSSWGVWDGWTARQSRQPGSRLASSTHIELYLETPEQALPKF